MATHFPQRGGCLCGDIRYSLADDVDATGDGKIYAIGGTTVHPDLELMRRFGGVAEPVEKGSSLALVEVLETRIDSAPASP